jgi:Gpi18-like mannosyltransferase
MTEHSPLTRPAPPLTGGPAAAIVSRPAAGRDTAKAGRIAAWCGVSVLGLAGFVAFISQLNVASTDMSGSLVPWYNYLLTHGRLAGLATVESDYPPAYLYLISFATLFDHVASPIVAVKLISIAFDGVAAGVLYRIALAAGRTRGTAWLAATLCLVLPSTVIDSALWGQCDIIYTAFLLCFALAMIRGRPQLAMLFLGLSFSFKLQAVFIAPAVFVLLLLGRVRWVSLAIVPLVYGAVAVPIIVAGRNIYDTLTIYLYQTHEYWMLSLGAQNPYLFATYLPYSVRHLPMLLWLAAAALLCLGLAVAMLLRSIRSDATAPSAEILLLCTASLTFVPYVLPAMHERYFFPAGIFGTALAMARPRLWPIALLLQISDSVMYLCFLYLPELTLAPYMALAATTTALVLLLREFGPLNVTPAAVATAIRSIAVPWHRIRT